MAKEEIREMRGTRAAFASKQLEAQFKSLERRLLGGATPVALRSEPPRACSQIEFASDEHDHGSPHANSASVARRVARWATIVDNIMSASAGEMRTIVDNALSDNNRAALAQAQHVQQRPAHLPPRPTRPAPCAHDARREARLRLRRDAYAAGAGRLALPERLARALQRGSTKRAVLTAASQIQHVVQAPHYAGGAGRFKLVERVFRHLAQGVSAGAPPPPWIISCADRSMYGAVRVDPGRRR